MPTCGALRDLVPFVQFKKRENIHGGVLTLVKFQASVYNFSKINTLPWVFFAFLKLYKWYQIAQRATLVFLFFVLCVHMIVLHVAWIIKFKQFFISKRCFVYLACFRTS